LFLCRALD